MEKDRNISYGQLIKTARHLKGLSMDDLCDLIGHCVSKQTISNYERGKSIPGKSFLKLIQSSLDLPIYYFSEPQATLTHIELRSKNNYTTKELSQLKTIIQTEISSYIHMETILGLVCNYSNPIVNIPIHNNGNIEASASMLRNKWNLGDSSIPYLCSQLEYRGIRIIEIQYDNQSFDGMSGIITHLQQPFIAINKNTTPERRRFTVAHELGHIVLNLDAGIENKEKPCNYFAGAMLFPRSAIEYELGAFRKAISLEELISIKDRYGISVAAIVHRAHDIGIINRSYYDHLYDDVINKNRMEIGWGGYKIEDIPRRYYQLKSRAISEGIIDKDTKETEITIL